MIKDPFLLPPFWSCPYCGVDHVFGVLMVLGRSYIRRCDRCRQRTEFELPALRKSVLYLDQYALSELHRSEQGISGRAGQGRHNQFWDELLALILNLCDRQALVCPKSSVHSQETLIYRDSEALKGFLDHLSGDTRFFAIEDIRRIQILRHFRCCLDHTPFDGLLGTREEVIDGHLDFWLDTVRPNLTLPQVVERSHAMTAERQKLAERLQAVSRGWTDDATDFQTYYTREVQDFGPASARRVIMDAAEYARAMRGEAEFTISTLLPSSSTSLFQTLVDELTSRHVSEQEASATSFKYLEHADLSVIPCVHNQALLYAATARQFAEGRKEPIDDGFASDVEFISTIAPYCDATVVDKRCHALLISEPVSSRLYGKTKFYSMRNRSDLIDYLRGLETAIPTDHRRLLADVYGDDMSSSRE